MTETTLITFVVALLSMMTPIGDVGVFVGMTADCDAADARRVAWMHAGAIAATLLVVTWTGGARLGFFEIKLHEPPAAG